MQRKMNKMEKTRAGFCLLLGLLGLIALSTAIAAELKHTRVEDVKYEHGECTLPSSPALWLGTISTMALLLSQLLANAMGGCVCCCTKNARKIPSTNRSIAILCLFVSWVTFGFAFFLLVAGSSMNQRQPYKKQWVDNECYVVKAGIFASAGVLSVLTVMLDIVFYIALTARKIEGLPVTTTQQSNGTVEPAQNVSGGAEEVTTSDGAKELP